MQPTFDEAVGIHLKEIRPPYAVTGRRQRADRQSLCFYAECRRSQAAARSGRRWGDLVLLPVRSRQPLALGPIPPMARLNPPWSPFPCRDAIGFSLCRHLELRAPFDRIEGADVA